MTPTPATAEDVKLAELVAFIVANRAVIHFFVTRPLRAFDNQPAPLGLTIAAKLDELAALWREMHADAVGDFKANDS